MEKVWNEFPVRTARALELLVGCDLAGTRFYSRGEDVYAVMDECGMVRCTVILKDTGAQPWQELTCYDREMTRESDGYRMTAEYFDEEAEQTRELNLYFRDAETVLEVFRAESAEERPWELLADLARVIRLKAEFGDEILNEREQRMMPLLGELVRFSRYDVETSCSPGFPELRGLFERYGYQELDKLVRNAEDALGTKRRHSRINALKAKLNRVKYEPLWRELYQTVMESQQDYPRRAESHPEFTALKKRIEWKLHQQGYRGKYPDFWKEGEVRRLHIAESYGQSYFLWNEKRAVFRIHCEESVYFEELCLSFQCATELLKSGQEPGDIHHCRFDSKGRTILRTVYHSNMEDGALEQKLTIAMKKAELRKLDKVERKLDGNVNLLGLSLAILIFGGGYFALFMLVGMAVISTAIIWLLEDWATAMEALKVLPWGRLAAYCWLGFGGCMALVEAWAKRN